ncbi:MAG: hypothetical protein MI867_07655 [Pseudomonadales bacterium]|nr:hypothetical protein [Pseudomonadales bacterium]
MKRQLQIIASSLLLSSTCALSTSVSAGIYDEGFENPTLGWRILQNDYQQANWLDVVSFEWDYFMVHNHDGRFAGIVGYVLANPRGRMDGVLEIVPNGGNAAFVGEVDHQIPVANYHNFGLVNTEVSDTERYMYAESDDQELYALIEPAFTPELDAEPALRLAGRSADFEWDLIVTQGMKDRDYLRHGDDAAFTLGPSTDVGIFKSEIWTVDAMWPRTNVVGKVVVRSTGEEIDIDGKGYRENSWGRYLLSIDGWDFLVFSEDHEDGVLMVMQTYHRSKELDFLDVSFYDNGELVAQRFRPTRNEFGWIHPDWQWDSRAQQCVPQNTVLKAENDDYLIEAEVEIGERQAPMLSDKTIGTRIYFIQEHFPSVTGTITNKTTGEVVSEFSGQAGGEFSFTKKLFGFPTSDSGCKRWGDRKFSMPFPDRS